MRTLITGGSRGIGAAIVRALHAASHSVLFTYAERREQAEALASELASGDSAAAERIGCVRCDLADRTALPKLIEMCAERFGGLDVLVNNAAIYDENPFDGDDYARWRAGWERTFAINLFGAADLAWLAIRVMRAQPPGERGVRGRIINVASRAAHRGELSYADYGASKAGLVNLTKSIARGCARNGIVAFAVAPGFIATEMAEEERQRHGGAIEAEIPSGRVGTPEEVAQIVAFLASGLADYATGTTIDVNGASYVR